MSRNRFASPIRSNHECKTAKYLSKLKAHNVDADKDNGKSAVSLIKKLTTQLAVLQLR